MGWISVNDKLPGHGDHVLCSNKLGKMYVLWYSVPSNSFFDGSDIFDKHHSYPITHWMPLPEPPKN